ncbi:hypothetical protein F4825DRAFT_412711 [Nemania diffusa]|nr:hypothetical protein F4825DRAFT_412711 [Nemania diffusa]
MHLHAWIAGVGLMATANAVLLPPDFSIADDTVATLPVPTEIDPDIALSKVPATQTVNLRCPGCFQIGRKHQKEIPSHLKLDFSIESTDGAERLALNGYELYPHPDPIRNILWAPVLPDMTSRRVGSPPRFKGGPNRPLRNQPLGFSMQTGAVTTDDDDDDLKLISVDIQIMQVGDVFVDHIPKVQVKLVKTPSGKLAIGTIDTVGVRFEAEHALTAQKECSTTLCRWKALFFDKFSKIFFSKGCGGSPPPSRHGGPPPPHHSGPPPLPHHSGPPSLPHHSGLPPPPPPPPHHGGPRPHHHHEGEHRHGHGHGHGPHHMGHSHGWAHGVEMVLTRIMFPLLIGIVAGISASIIGMMFGTFVVFVWRTFFRRRSSRSSHRCRYAHKAAKYESAVDEEKSGLLADQAEAEAPPVYMDSHLAASEDKKLETGA